MGDQLDKAYFILSVADKNCPVCKGTGFVDKGKVVEICHCRFREEDFEKRLNIPKKFWKAELENYQPISPAQQRAYQACKAFVLSFEPEAGRGITLVGPSQMGKTHLIVGVLKALYRDKRIRGFFFDTKEMLFQLRFYMNHEEDKYGRLLKFLMNVPVLALDDLGSERLSDWSVEILSLIITYRYNNLLSTLITTNYQLRKSENEILNSLEERISPGVVGKIFHMNEVVYLS
ncbi:ATP-binding protein [Thermocrinis sp.]